MIKLFHLFRALRGQALFRSRFWNGLVLLFARQVGGVCCRAIREQINVIWFLSCKVSGAFCQQVPKSSPPFPSLCLPAFSSSTPTHLPEVCAQESLCNSSCRDSFFFLTPKNSPQYLYSTPKSKNVFGFENSGVGDDSLCPVLPVTSLSLG